MNIIRYDHPIPVSATLYDRLMQQFAGAIAGRFNPQTRSYEVKIWIMRYKKPIEQLIAMDALRK